MKFKVSDNSSGLDYMSARYENVSESTGFTLSVYPSNGHTPDEQGYYGVANGGLRVSDDGEFELQWVNLQDSASNSGMIYREDLCSYGIDPETLDISITLEEYSSSSAPTIHSPNITELESHHYQIIDQFMTFDDVQAHANSLSYNAMSGHLVTIISSQENDYIYYLIGRSLVLMINTIFNTTIALA